MPTFGERFKELRKMKKLTQEKLAEMFSINKSSISRYEKNTQMPEMDTLKKFANFFDVSIDYLLGRTDVKNINSEEYRKIEFNPTLNKKDMQDIEKILNKTIEVLQTQEGLMLNGEILDEEDVELLTQAIKNGLEYAKISNKKKYTPKKYRNNINCNKNIDNL